MIRPGQPVPDQIEKLMSLTETEFHQSLARLGPSRSVGARNFRFAAGSGSVTVSFEPVAGVTLGGLLALPRARVVLTFSGASDAEKGTFLKNFEFTFQRGGG